MAQIGKITEVFDLAAVQKQIDTVNGMLNTTMLTLEKIATTADKIKIEVGDAKKTSDVAKATKDLAAAQDKAKKAVTEMTELQKQEQKLIDQKLRLEKQLLTAGSDEAKQIQQLKLHIADKNKQQKEDIKLRGQAKDSIITVNAQVK